MPGRFVLILIGFGGRCDRIVARIFCRCAGRHGLAFRYSATATIRSGKLVFDVRASPRRGGICAVVVPLAKLLDVLLAFLRELFDVLLASFSELLDVVLAALSAVLRPGRR